VWLCVLEMERQSRETLLESAARRYLASLGVALVR
jgi:hypothetical protein